MADRSDLENAGHSAMQAVSILPAGTHTTLRCEQWVPKPLGEVFAFFADAHNLEQITPPFLRFSVRSMSTPAVRQGTEITYRLRLHRLPISWTGRIEVWEPPYRFTDVQIRGPFRLWHHQHDFTPEHNGTSIRDTVHYRAPCAWLQHIPFLRWVDNDLQRIFTYRQQIIECLFGGENVTEGTPLSFGPEGVCAHPAPYFTARGAVGMGLLLTLT